MLGIDRCMIIIALLNSGLMVSAAACNHKGPCSFSGRAECTQVNYPWHCELKRQKAYFGCVKLIIRNRISSRGKPNILVCTGMNALTNSVNTTSKVRKIVKAVEEMDGSNEMKLGFSSIITRKDRDLEKEIKETNTKLINCSIGKGFIWIGRELLYLQKIFTNCFLLGLKEMLFNIQL